MLRYTSLTHSAKRWAWPSSSRVLLSAAALNNNVNSSLESSLRVEVHPGTRLLYVDQPEGTNPLNTLAAIKHKLSLYEANATLAAVVINVDNLHLLSSIKTHGPPSSEGFKTAFKATNDFANALKTSVKPTVAIFNGNVSNAALSAFAPCSVRTHPNFSPYTTHLALVLFLPFSSA